MQPQQQGKMQQQERAGDKPSQMIDRDLLGALRNDIEELKMLKVRIAQAKERYDRESKLTWALVNDKNMHERVRSAL